MHKKWYDKNISQKDVNEALDFLKVFKIKVVFIKAGHPYWTRDGIVHLPINRNVRYFWSALFHEMCHELCAREDVYSTYHSRKRTPKSKNLHIRKIGLKAEIYVDKRAEKLMRKLLPAIPYHRGYRSKKDKKWYKEWLDEYYPNPN